MQYGVHTLLGMEPPQMPNERGVEDEQSGALTATVESKMVSEPLDSQDSWVVAPLNPPHGSSTGRSTRRLRTADSRLIVGVAKQRRAPDKCTCSATRGHTHPKRTQ